jgi:hypothetical protein
LSLKNSRLKTKNRLFCLLAFSFELLAIFVGGGERDRTDDLLRAKQALSQLSYTPTKFAKQILETNWLRQIVMVGLVGIEPTTSRLSGVRSNRD